MFPDLEGLMPFLLSEGKRKPLDSKKHFLFKVFTFYTYIFLNKILHFLTVLQTKIFVQ